MKSTLSKLKNTLHTKSVYKKIVILFALIIFLSAFLFSFLYRKGENLVKKELSNALFQQNINTALTFSEEIKRILMMQDGLIETADIITLKIADSQNDAPAVNESILIIQKSLLTIWRGSRFIDDIQILLPDSGLLISTGTARKDETTYESLKDKLQDFGSNRLFSLDGQLVISSEFPSFSLQNNQEPDYIISAFLSNDAVDKYLNSSGMIIDKTFTHLLYDDQQKLFLGKNNDPDAIPVLEKLLQSEAATKQVLSYKGYLVTISPIENSTLLCVSFASSSELFGDLNLYHTLFFLLAISVLLTSIYFFRQTFLLIHEPLKHLLSGFEEVKKGNLDVSISYRKEDEFKHIYTSFNDMTSRIRNLIDNNYKQEILLKKAELKQLQAQISPHFLYNSFLILSNRISSGDDEFAASFSRQLAQYFMFITRNKADFIPLSEEVAHAYTYSSIQKTRFQNRFDMSWELLPDSCKTLIVPRLILQPVIENIFKYVVEPNVDSSFLHVSYVTEEDYLEILIEDNGHKLTEEEIASMNRQLVQPEGEVHSTANINQRLMIAYAGKGYLTLSSSSYGGLKVTIRIPFSSPFTD